MSVDVEEDPAHPEIEPAAPSETEPALPETDVSAEQAAVVGSTPGSLDTGEEADKEQARERSCSVGDTSHRCRSKRESRRMRELEQAQFSLELLKVRATGAGGPLPEEAVVVRGGHGASEERGSPASHESFELLAVEDMETEASGSLDGSREHPEIEPFGTPPRDSNYNEKPVFESPAKEQAQRATFYISDQSPVHKAKCESPGKVVRERRESSSRRPVVMIITMQKESPVDELELQAAQALERTSDVGESVSGSRPTTIAGLELGTARDRPSRPSSSHAKTTAPPTDGSPEAASSTTHAADTAVSPAVCSSEVDIQLVLEPRPSAQPPLPSQQDRKAGRSTPGSPALHLLETKPPKAQKKSSAQTVIVNMTEKPATAVCSQPRRKLPFSK